MTFKDWVQAAALALTLIGVVAQARVAMALRTRDREDFEALRDDFKKEQESTNRLRERVATLEGKGS